MLKVAFDLDNTIADHSPAFRILAKEFGVPVDEFSDKKYIKNYLINENKQHIWTILQGRVYGASMNLSTPYDGLLEALMSLFDKIDEFQIISHRGKWAHSGEKINLHEPAINWVEDLFTAFPKTQFRGIKLAETLDAKIDLINAWGPQVLVDDLETVIQHQNLDSSIVRVHFDPEHISSSWVSDKLFRMKCWSDFSICVQEVAK